MVDWFSLALLTLSPILIIMQISLIVLRNEALTRRIFPIQAKRFFVFLLSFILLVMELNARYLDYLSRTTKYSRELYAIRHVQFTLLTLNFLHPEDLQPTINRVRYLFDASSSW